MMTAREAAAALRGQATGPQTLLAPGPGHGPRDRSLSVKLDPEAPDGFKCHSFAGDHWQVCRDHVRAALGLRSWRDGGAEAPRPTPKPEAVDGDLGAWGLRLWGEARDAKGTLAERYLAGRGLKLDGRARGALRFHRSCPFGKGKRFPCMVALFRDLRTDKPVAIQRTALTPDGEKIDRMMAGPVAGAAVKFDPDYVVTLGLAVSEGVELAMAARMLGFRPAWALGSAGAIGRLPVLPGVEALTVLGEIDETGANARATRACADRWLNAGVEVSVIEPDAGDLNDVVQARSRR